MLAKFALFLVCFFPSLASKLWNRFDCSDRNGGSGSYDDDDNTGNVGLACRRDSHSLSRSNAFPFRLLRQLLHSFLYHSICFRFALARWSASAAHMSPAGSRNMLLTVRTNAGGKGQKAAFTLRIQPATCLLAILFVFFYSEFCSLLCQLGLAPSHNLFVYVACNLCPISSTKILSCLKLLQQLQEFFSSHPSRRLCLLLFSLTSQINLH